MISNEEKQRVWQAYRDRRPVRVPVTISTNARVVLLDEKWNPGVTFQECFSDVDALIQAQLRHLEYRCEFIHLYCDSPVGLPKEYAFNLDRQNTYDAEYFGAKLFFADGQVPDAHPLLCGADKERVFDIDIEHPLDNPMLKRCLRMHEELTRKAAGLRYKGIRFTVAPLLLSFDGPLTIAAALRGQEIFLDIYEDRDYFHRLLSFLTRGAILRRQALLQHFGLDPAKFGSGFFADDSIQLISTDAFREHVLPYHRQWYDRWAPQGPRGIHLCGDATRHFPLLRDELRVYSFDTGFPVNHGALRKALGGDVEIMGGPEVALLHGGSAEQVYARCKAILQSGVMAGGRFILREANNLPPCCPEQNLAAMYQACLEWGNLPVAHENKSARSL